MAKRKRSYKRYNSYKPKRRRYSRRKESGMFRGKNKQMLIGAGIMLALVVFAPDVVSNVTSILGYTITAVPNTGGA